MSAIPGTVVSVGQHFSPAGQKGKRGERGERGARGPQGAKGATGPKGPEELPTGVIIPFGGALPPSGWLACDGASYNVSAYPELHAVIGYDFGGSGSQFNVPDTRARVLVGVGGLDNEVPWRWSLGQKAGTARITLAAAETPAHFHNLYVDHYHQVNLDHYHAVVINAHNHAESGHRHLYEAGWGHWYYSWCNLHGTANKPNYTFGWQPSARMSAAWSGLANAGNPGGWTNYVSEQATNWHVRNTAWMSQIHGAANRDSDSRGSGQAHTNVQPSLGVTHLIKAT